jgi:endonuclease G, mitochondrial
MKFFSHKLFVVLFLLLSLTVYSQDRLFLPEKSRGEIIHHTEFSLSYVEQHEQAEWVNYILTKEMIDSASVSRTNRFKADDKVSTGSAHPDDYKYSGYDRGHLCPAGDMKHSETAMHESFLMSNISPQIPSFNRNTWKRLEDRVRVWAVENDSLIIVVGGVLEDSLKKIGPDSAISVPNYFYKVILNNLFQKEKMIGFLFENKSSNAILKSFVVAVDSIEALTGLDFFPFLPDSLEEELESFVNIDSWSFKTEKGESTYNQSEKKNSEKEKVVYEQCKAITKAGTQCKRKGVYDGYCYQHKQN